MLRLRYAYGTPMVRLWYKSHLRIEILPFLLVLEVRDELPYGIDHFGFGRLIRNTLYITILHSPGPLL